MVSDLLLLSQLGVRPFEIREFLRGEVWDGRFATQNGYMTAVGCSLDQVADEPDVIVLQRSDAIE